MDEVPLTERGVEKFSVHELINERLVEGTALTTAAAAAATGNMNHFHLSLSSSLRAQ